MLSDLFTVFDYAWGCGSSVAGVSVWFSGLLVPLFVVTFCSFWYMPGYFDSVMSWMYGLFLVKAPEEVKWSGGTAHLFVSLFLMLLIFNLFGIFPYHYPLSSHFLLSISFAFPFWFASVFSHFNFNGSLFFIKWVYRESNVVSTAMIMVSELVSFLARPLTLSCRLTMNFIIGGIVVSLVNHMGVGVLYPFFWYMAESFGGEFLESSGVAEVNYVALCLSGFFWTLKYSLYLVYHFFVFFLSFALFFVEMAVSVLQALIFTGLLVFYVYEVPLKPLSMKASTELQKHSSSVDIPLKFYLYKVLLKSLKMKG